MSNPALSYYSSPYSVADPLQPPKSLRILGVFSIGLALLSLPLIVLSTVFAAKDFAYFAGVFDIEPDPYILWLDIMAAIAGFMTLMQLLAGIGLTLRRPWGRTWGLIWCIAVIPICLALILGFVIDAKVLEVNAQMGHVAGAAEVHPYVVYNCEGPAFAIVMMIFLFARPARRWAKAMKEAKRNPQAFAAYRAGANAPASPPPPPPPYIPATPAPAPSPPAPIPTPRSITPAAPGGALYGDQLPVTYASEAPLRVAPPPPPPPPPPTPSAPVTLHAASPLELAAESSPTPLAFGVPMPAPAASTPPTPPAAALAAAGPAVAPPPPPPPPMGAAAPSSYPPPPYAQAPAYAPGPFEPDPPMSKAALVGFLLSLFPVIPVVGHIVAFTLGIIGLKRIARANGKLRGRGFAITAIVISSCVLLMVLILAITVAILISQEKSPAAPWKPEEPVPTTAIAPRISPELPASFTNSLGMEFARIKPGTFMMGSPLSERQRDADETFHRVTLTTAFYMGVHDVRVRDFRAFTKANWNFLSDAEKAGESDGWNSAGNDVPIKGLSWFHTGFDQTEDHPVVLVSWNDATAFCAWLSKTEGRHYRLPTEAQWEFACRAATSTAYPWGNLANDGNGWCNVGDLTLDSTFLQVGDTFGFRDNYVYTSPVGVFKPNPWGLYDMIGNVRQWCADRNDDLPYTDQIDPQGPATGSQRVIRGASWRSLPSAARSAYRNSLDPDERTQELGFRLVLDAADVGPD